MLPGQESGQEEERPGENEHGGEGVLTPRALAKCLVSFHCGSRVFLQPNTMGFVWDIWSPRISPHQSQVFPVSGITRGRCHHLSQQAHFWDSSVWVQPSQLMPPKGGGNPEKARHGFQRESHWETQKIPAKSGGMKWLGLTLSFRKLPGPRLQAEPATESVGPRAKWKCRSLSLKIVKTQVNNGRALN